MPILWLYALSAAAAFVAAGILVRRWAKHAANDPRVILRQCRLELHDARKDLTQYPATRELRDILRTFDTTELTIDEIEAKL